MKIRAMISMALAWMTWAAALAAPPIAAQPRTASTAPPPHAHVPPAPALRPVSVAGRGTTRVTVRNRTGDPVVLYLRRAGDEELLGAVAPRQEQTILLPEHRIAGARSLSISLRPEGGGGPGWGPYALRAGSRLFLTTPPGKDGPPPAGRPAPG